MATLYWRRSCYLQSMGCILLLSVTSRGCHAVHLQSLPLLEFIVPGSLYFLSLAGLFQSRCSQLLYRSKISVFINRTQSFTSISTNQFFQPCRIAEKIETEIDLTKRDNILEPGTLYKVVRDCKSWCVNCNVWRVYTCSEDRGMHSRHLSWWWYPTLITQVLNHTSCSLFLTQPTIVTVYVMPPEAAISSRRHPWRGGRRWWTVPNVTAATWLPWKRRQSSRL